MPQLEPGNIDIHNRPVVKNPDGSISTVRSITVGFDDGQYVLPTISDDGKTLTDDEAIALFKLTGKHLGKFDNEQEANSFAQSLHEQQAEEYIMPQTANPSIADELRKRGLLATGGMHRLAPMTGDSNLGSGNAVNTLPASRTGSITQNEDGTLNAADINGNPVVVDPNNITPEQADSLSDDSLNGLLPFLTGVAGGVLAERLLRKRGTKGNGAAVDVPVVEGEVIEGKQRIPGNHIIEGEFTEIDPVKSGPNRLAGAKPVKQLTGPTTNSNQLSAPANRLEGTTAKALAARRLGKAQPTEQSRIIAADEFSDFTPEELAKARSIAEELVRRRERGNVKAFNPNRKFARTGGLPTSRGNKTETVDEMMGNVVRVLRDQKALQALRKAR